MEVAPEMLHHVTRFNRKGSFEHNGERLVSFWVGVAPENTKIGRYLQKTKVEGCPPSATFERRCDFSLVVSVSNTKHQNIRYSLQGK